MNNQLEEDSVELAKDFNATTYNHACMLRAFQLSHWSTYQAYGFTFPEAYLAYIMDQVRAITLETAEPKDGDEWKDD